jgi:hypothetical protein
MDLENLQNKVAGQIGELGKLQEYHGDNLEAVERRYKYAGAFKDLSGQKHDTLLQAIHDGYKQWRAIKTYLDSTAPNQLHEAEALVTKCRDAFEAFERKEEPKTHNPAWNELFEFLIGGEA